MANARQTRRAETRRNQRAERTVLHPRGLARSIAKALGAGEDWRSAVAGLPARGERLLHPERRKERGSDRRDDPAEA